MSGITNETMLTLSEASRLQPRRNGRPISISTVLRWILNGVADPQGNRVRLEAVRLGSRWITSKEALARFAERQTPKITDEVPLPVRPQGQRESANQAAQRHLEESGVC